MSAGFSQNQRSTGGHRPPVQQTKTALRQFCNTLKSAGELPLQFAYLAGIAALTEIPNRRFYYERLLQEIARARRSSSPLTLALVDLDRFKQINDDVGHRGGDQVLKFFSQFIRVNLRQEDIVCRIGGDEFAIILPDTNVDNAAAFFEIRSKLNQVEISIDRRSSRRLSFSCGLAVFRSEYLPEDLIEEADHSLYSAKAGGRNRVVNARTAPSLVSQSVH